MGRVRGGGFVWGGRLRPPSSATKFLTVEELVKVITCGLCAGSFITDCSFFFEASGTTVSIRFNYFHCRSHLAQFPGNHIARHRRTHQQDPLPSNLLPQTINHRFGNILGGTTETFNPISSAALRVEGPMVATFRCDNFSV